MLEVICGPMFSGKTEELIRRLRRAQVKYDVAAYKPVIDNRWKVEHIQSHNGSSFDCTPIPTPLLIGSYGDVIGFDEAQFFSRHDLLEAVDGLRRNKLIIVAGLDNDYKQDPFGAMPTLMRLADTVTKLTAVCHKCGADAIFTQRLVGGNPTTSGPVIQIGAEESYEARCFACYVT